MPLLNSCLSSPVLTLAFTFLCPFLLSASTKAKSLGSFLIVWLQMEQEVVLWHNREKMGKQAVEEREGRTHPLIFPGVYLPGKYNSFTL